MEEKHSHSGHRQRIKNRVKKYGFKSLEPHEMLEVMLTYSIPRKDTNEIAHSLLKNHSTIAGVIDAEPSQLKLVNGVGSETILFFNILKDFVDVYLESKRKDKIIKLDTPLKCIEFVKEHFQKKKVECFYVLCLTKTEVLSHYYVTEGESEQEIELPVKAFADNISSSKVKKVVVIHTHTNEDVTPSFNDINTTERINGICTVMGVDLVDHIILTENSYFSFRNSGMIKPMKYEDANKIIQSFNIMINYKRK